MPEPDPRFEVPPEYADVYERAFRRASDAGREGEDEPDRQGPTEPPRRRRAPLLVGAAVLLLVVAVAAYALGRASERERVRTAPASVSASPSSQPTVRSSIAPLDPVSATSTCRQPVVTGSDGTALSFAPGNVLDEDARTSWACAGNGVGQELVLSLPPGSRVSRVGLLPASDVSGVGLNRIRAVDWLFDDGTTVHQSVAPGSAESPAPVQLQSIPTESTASLRLRITAVDAGPADLTAISSVFLSRPTS